MIASTWLTASLAAGLFQAWRTALQQRLRAELNVSGAALVRYLYGAPVAVLLLVAYAVATGFALPELTGSFFVFATLGGLAQIVGTILLIAAFGYRNFVVGTAFAKTEALQVALIAWLVFGERLGPVISLGVVAGVAGVFILSLGGQRILPGQIAKSLGQPAALCGLGAGASFAITSVLVKRAIIDLHQQDAIGAALTTLAAVTLLQSFVHGAYIALREPAVLRAVAISWRVSSRVGALSAAGSACWFIGFATGPIALVRIVGQVEVVFTLLLSRLYLRERAKGHEIAGLLLVALGVALALVGAAES